MIYRKVVKSDVFKFQIPCICTLAAFVISEKLSLKFLSYIAGIKVLDNGEVAGNEGRQILGVGGVTS